MLSSPSPALSPSRTAPGILPGGKGSESTQGQLPLFTWNTFYVKTTTLYELHHLEFRLEKCISFHLLENTSCFHFIMVKVKFYITLTENFVSCFLTSSSIAAELYSTPCTDLFNLFSLYTFYFLSFCLFIKAVWPGLNAFSLFSFQATIELSSCMKASLFITFSTFYLFFDSIALGSNTTWHIVCFTL